MQLNPKTREAYNLFHDGILALGRAEQQGIRVDVEYIEEKQAQLTKRIDWLYKRVEGTKFYHHWEHSQKGKVNIMSDAQLARFLYDVKKLKPIKLTPTKKGSTDEESLTQLNIPELNHILKIRKLKQLRDTFLEGFRREQVNGVMHPFYNLNLARTFRSSSDRPNFQNIPKRDHESMQICRKALYPRKGHQLLEIDFSGLEVRIAACYHKDPTMLAYINDPTTDMHRDMAEQLFKFKYDKAREDHYTLRQAAKNGFVFPQFYGDYFGNNAVDLACMWGGLPMDKWKPGDGIEFNDSQLANHLIDNKLSSLGLFTKHVQKIERDFWENRFPDYAAWKERWWQTYQKNGYIDLLTGFRCSGVMGRNDCINYPVQGAAFHCLLWCIIELDKIARLESWKTKLVGQIHDSILIDAHPEELEYVARVVKRVTCEDLPKAWPWISVPLDVDADLCAVDASWADKEKYEFK